MFEQTQKDIEKEGITAYWTWRREKDLIEAVKQGELGESRISTTTL